MSAVPQSMSATSLDRRIQMLRTAMGPLIATALEDPDVVEIMLNPDRTLWVDRLSSGRAPMGVEMPEADGERIIRLVAATSARKSIAASRCYPPNCPKPANASRASCRPPRQGRPSRCANAPSA
jgi:hypothetical protein